MISCDGSSSVVKDLGVQYGGPWFERWSVTFFRHFLCTFFTPLLQYFDPAIYNVWFLPCNSVAVKCDFF